jgi:RNA 3'-phosphate cyclase
MLLVDGGYGEGGGQIIRSAIAFSSLTSTPIKVVNVRSKRENPGLRPQHVTAINAVASICSAEVAGCSIGSTEFSFTPADISGGFYRVDVGTAGSVTLVMQAVMPLALKSRDDITFTVSGGTDVKWSPPADYLKYVTLGVLTSFGFKADLDVNRRGYYPKGGGLVELKLKPSRLERVELIERGLVESVRGVSHAHTALRERRVCERQSLAARKNLVDYETRIECVYCDTGSIGSGITLFADCGNTVLGSDCLGDRKMRSEEVGSRASRDLTCLLDSDCVLDDYMVDQIIPYLAYSGGCVKTGRLTSHAETNIWLARQFGFDVTVREGFIEC